jgi:antitoxin (DNA-binding transcriptional repressor) of toxin-antitoxin stability system
MTNAINSQELKLNLDDVLNLVGKGETFQITYKAKPIGFLIPTKKYQPRRWNSTEIAKFIESCDFSTYQTRELAQHKNTKMIYHDLLKDKYKKYAE